MRPYTLAFSILAHVLVAGAIGLAPIVVNDAMPEPRRPFAFVDVRAIAPPSIPAPRRASGARTAKAVSAAAAPVEAPDRVEPETSFETEGLGVADGIVGVPDGVADSILTDAPAPPPPVEKTPAAPIRIGGAIQPPQKTRHAAPVYPAIARAAGVQGTVILQVVIGEDGRVRGIEVLRSIRLLDQAAIDAVRQWQFTPTRLNGEPVPIVMSVTVTFTLQP